MTPLDYVKDGAEIYRRSFATIRREAELSRFSPLEERIAVRIEGAQIPLGAQHEAVAVRVDGQALGGNGQFDRYARANMWNRSSPSACRKTRNSTSRHSVRRA